MSARLVGIDLGTTNCALAWVDSPSGTSTPRPRVFQIPQLVAPGEMDARSTLPSFLYFPTPEEVEGAQVQLPWAAHPDLVAGAFARDHGALVPQRQVSSAKSWLSNPFVDRRAPILPWTPDAPRRLSPVEASARLLLHLREAWNGHWAAAESAQLQLQHQQVVLTVPASFDEEARELTVDAARDAGLGPVTLLEEPLAALYAWMAGHPREAARRLAQGQLILVCDVGGGTTDFSLIRARSDGGELRFERTAIGEHLLLGGDNMDLALATRLEAALGPGAARLTVTQRQALRRQCSAAKERLLGEGAPEELAITVLGSGRGVVGGAMTAVLAREAVGATLEEFLPIGARDARPHKPVRAGLRELGLPYESDPAITRHLAAFLARAARLEGATPHSSDGMARPDAILFNGGFFTPARARDRIAAALEHWFGTRPDVLTTPSPEAAVAIGAACYAALRARPESSRTLLVRAGSARAYYVGVHDAAGGHAADTRAAVCVMPRGTNEGSRLAVEREFSVVTNQPAAFTLFSSLDRQDALGDVVTFAATEDVHQHAALVTALRYGQRSRRVPLTVRLSVVFTEVGTLELWCESLATGHRWRLQFNLRAVESDDSAPRGREPGDQDDDRIVIPDDAVTAAEGLLRAAFTPAPGSPGTETLMGELENVLGHGKQSWPLPVIRRLADVLLETSSGRRLSARHEARWLNLTGFCMRPGLGAPVDPWRIAELRKVYATDLAFPRDTQTQVEWWILWQRVGAGFTAAQQQELARRLIGLLGLGARKAPRLNPQIVRETWRLLGALERLDPAQRVRLGNELASRVRREPSNAALAWALGRFGARTPLYGPLSSVVSPAAAEAWLEMMLGLKSLALDARAAMVQMAARTGDPARDVADAVRDRVHARLEAEGASEDFLRPLTDIVPVERQDLTRMFGEALPEGLRVEAS